MKFGFPVYKENTSKGVVTDTLAQPAPDHATGHKHILPHTKKSCIQGIIDEQSICNKVSINT